MGKLTNGNKMPTRDNAQFCFYPFLYTAICCGVHLQYPAQKPLGLCFYGVYSALDKAGAFFYNQNDYDDGAPHGGYHKGIQAHKI
jgi:hypothetical protein